MGVGFDAEKIREMATAVRGNAELAGKTTLLSVGAKAVETMQHSKIADCTDEMSPWLNKVIGYHVDRLNEIASLAEIAANELLAQEHRNATSIADAGPR